MPSLLQLIAHLLSLKKEAPNLDHLLPICAALRTDVGRKRPINEDSMTSVIPDDPRVLLKKGALFIVADGLGGHAKGEVASRMTVEAVSNVYYQEKQSSDIASLLLHAVQRANGVIYQQIDVEDKTSFGAMGSTCTAAVLQNNVAYIANVGDSRAYMIRQGQIRQISQDHSWVAEQVRAGKLTQEQAHGHARGNIITRCLGTSTGIEVDVFIEPVQDGDTLLLCSDGLTNFLSNEELAAFVEQYDLQESVDQLIACANERGGTDNITVIVVRVGNLTNFSLNPRLALPQRNTFTPDSTNIDEDRSDGTRKLRTFSNNETLLR